MQNLIDINWDDIKDFVANRRVSLQWIEVEKFYYLRAFDSNMAVGCTIKKDSTPNADQSDFETNYKNQGGDNKHPTSQVTQTLGKDDLTLRAQGSTFTASAGTTTEHLYLCTLAYAINGGAVYTENSKLGDSISIDIIDKDGILGAGPNFVLPGTEFVKDWKVFPNKEQIIEAPFVSYLPAPGLYIRIKYTSAGASDVEVGINYKLYELSS